ncbi:MAG: CDP-archaeol synthase [Chloroflexota bacterium]|nr:CDP-archaeol synthase [Chloroflexota bacterium]
MSAALLGVIEFYRLAAQRGWQSFTLFGIIWTTLSIYFAHRGGIHIPLLLGGAVTISFLWFAFRRFVSGSDTEQALAEGSWTLLGIIYVGWLLGIWILLRRSFGWEWVILALFSTFAVDTCAYFIGRAFGRHKLAPIISPGKTWEGAIGGLFGGLAATIALAMILGLIGEGYPGQALAMPVSYASAVVVGLFIGLFAQLGDLTESKIKRVMGVKEAGNLIPGHGGILDRLDSVVFTGVVVYYSLCLIL